MSTFSQRPFSQLSTTLLLAIFETVCDNEGVHLPLQPSHPRHVLNLVCKRWFTIVRSTFSLWDTIHFDAPNADTVHPPHPVLRQFAFCDKLSGLNPLTITFNKVCKGWGFSFVGSIIVPYAHQIQRLSGIIYRNTDIAMFLTIAEGQFIILESIDICFVDTLAKPISSFSLTDCLQFTALRTAPCLLQASFHLLNRLHPVDLHLPWRQLSTLNLGTVAMPSDVLMKILHSSTLQLEDGCFYARFIKPMHPDLILSRQRITMHALQALRLRLFFPSQDSRLFSLLRLPALQCLQIEMYDKFQDWDVSLYNKLLAASTQTLRELRFDDYPPHGSSDFVVKRRYRKTKHQVLDKFFKIIKNIQTLHLPPGVDIHMPTVEKMASYTLLPKLSSLELCSIDGWPILDMARRRHELFLDASLSDHSEFETGPSQPVIDFHLFGPPKRICMLIPRGWTAEEKRALVGEAQALGLLGIRCIIQSTDMLPLPIINPREVIRARLLAWVVGVPRDDLA